MSEIRNQNQTKEQSKEQTEFLQKHRAYHRKIAFFRGSILCVFLALWQIAVLTNQIDPFFFSSPIELILKAKDFFTDKAFWMHTGITTYETILSFLIVSLISFAFGFVLWRYEFISKVLEPYFVILNSIPKSALAPLLIVWLGTGSTTIIVCGLSVAVFGSIVNFYYAFKECEQGKIILIKTLGGNDMQCFRKVVFPSAIPLLFSASKVNVGLSLVGVIIGEFLAGRRGLGYLIIYGSQVFLLSQVIFCILILCLIAFILYRVLQFIEHKTIAKMGVAGDRSI